MPSFFPEGNTVLPKDNELRLLAKLVSLTASGGGGGGGSGYIFHGNGPPSGPQTGQTNLNAAAIYYDDQAPGAWYPWDTSGHTWPVIPDSP